MSPTKNAAEETQNFTAEERAAMKDRANEVRRSRKAGKNEDLEPEVLAKIADMPGDDREMAQRVHDIVRAAAPELAPKLWYGMPAYAKDGKVVCFFKPGSKFKVRYGELGFNDAAALDDGAMWPTAYALTTIGDAEEKAIAALVERAAG
ncbi:iron chaperone [Cellulomonas sp. HZM]|uniref:iron chaperone n=1 Tax=Cellulomonas sp. HZM TaxID=1454010 RepID=UPI0004936AE6|nr:DUF1801 domain-containing protein [Cellulomonas sp. HZM]